jgi:hypothetical protein
MTRAEFTRRKSTASIRPMGLSPPTP